MAYTYKYPRPAVTTDCVVITKESEPKVLLIERGDDPYKGCWAFPGGFMEMDETTEQCAIRELEEETGLQVHDVIQIGAYSKVNRDPRGRTITVAYLAIVDAPMVVTGHDDAAKAQWYDINALPPLAFDHGEIMDKALMLYRSAVLCEGIQHDTDFVAENNVPEDGNPLPVRTVFVLGQIDHGCTSLANAISKERSCSSSYDRIDETKELALKDAERACLHLDHLVVLTENLRYELYDAFGYSDKVMALLGGAVIPDAAIIVVAADEGIKPQTRDLLLLMKQLDVMRVIVFINKCDKVEPACLNTIHDSVRKVLAELGFYKDTPVVFGSAKGALEGIRQWEDSIGEIVEKMDTWFAKLPDNVLRLAASSHHISQQQRKFRATILMLTPQQGGLKTPFFNGYQTKCRFQHSMVSCIITLTNGTLMVEPGDYTDVEMELLSGMPIEPRTLFRIEETGRVVGIGVLTGVA